MLLSLDLETTGLDLRHSARPFFCTICYENGEQDWYEWDVDPHTRNVDIPKEDIESIRATLKLVENWANYDQEIQDRHVLIGHNFKFDATALDVLGISTPWSMLRDTLIAGHLLSSNTAHDLTSMVRRYLGDEFDISPYEYKLEEAVKAARREVRKKAFIAKHGEWAIARNDSEDMPSTREFWRADYWLPRAVAKAEEYPESHEWWTVLSDYANMDSACNLPLWKKVWSEICRKKLDKIYRCRMQALPIAFGMEKKGVTVSSQRLFSLVNEYVEQSAESEAKCVHIAKGMSYDLVLPKGSSNNKSLTQFCFGELKEDSKDWENPLQRWLKLPIVAKTKTGQPSLDKEALGRYLLELDRKKKEYHFIKHLARRRKRAKALEALTSYQRFWLPTGIVDNDGNELWYRIHPSFNMTGTATLRWSSSNPNAQNIAKQSTTCQRCYGDGCDECNGTGEDLHSLRVVFGPEPNREWWVMDAENLELRIPSYEANEKEMINLFERPKDPPYFGSNHLLVAHILHPQLFEECINDDGILDGRIFKKKYDSSWYQWVKNGNFAVTYGAIKESGTADRAYHVPGGQAIIENRFTNIKRLNKKCIAMAERLGYVETLPDKTVDPERGYPVYCGRTEWGKVLPTTPLNYHVQSSAMWWTMKCMIKTEEVLESWRSDGFDAHMVLQVHDELVFDLPKREHPKKNPKRSNLGRARILQKIMGSCGYDFVPEIPITVSLKYCDESWASGESL